MKTPAIPVLLALLAALPAAARPPAKPVKTERALSPDALVLSARAAAHRGDIDTALRLAQSAIVADPARPSSYVAVGDIYAEAGQAEFARSYYEAALAIDPQAPAALAALDDTNHRLLAKP